MPKDLIGKPLSSARCTLKQNVKSWDVEWSPVCCVRCFNHFAAKWLELTLALIQHRDGEIQ